MPAYTDIGHSEERAELWAWAPGQPRLWRASTVYRCYGWAAAGMPFAGPAHYEVLGSSRYDNKPVDWYEARCYAQGRVSHKDKCISLSMASYDTRKLSYVVKLLARTWPGYTIWKDYVEVHESMDENLVEAA
jgi:hypothetical protein